MVLFPLQPIFANAQADTSQPAGRRRDGTHPCLKFPTQAFVDTDVQSFLSPSPCVNKKAPVPSARVTTVEAPLALRLNSTPEILW
jgi:hypothetical protein